LELGGQFIPIMDGVRVYLRIDLISFFCNVTEGLRQYTALLQAHLATKPFLSVLQMPISDISSFAIDQI
jgi:hypothetical protein